MKSDDRLRCGSVGNKCCQDTVIRLKPHMRWMSIRSIRLHIGFKEQFEAYWSRWAVIPTSWHPCKFASKSGCILHSPHLKKAEFGEKSSVNMNYSIPLMKVNIKSIHVTHCLNEGGLCRLSLFRFDWNTGPQIRFPASNPTQHNKYKLQSSKPGVRHDLLMSRIQMYSCEFN